MRVIKLPSARSPKGGWSTGTYACSCSDCHANYTGAKGSFQCADCAHGLSDHAGKTQLTEVQVTYLIYLLESRRRVMTKAAGILETDGDTSTLQVVLRRLELKLRRLGVQVDSFASGG